MAFTHMSANIVNGFVKTIKHSHYTQVETGVIDVSWADSSPELFFSMDMGMEQMWIIFTYNPKINGLNCPSFS